jgi:DNA (cytosine-5)-methyltransferase 1
MQAKFRFAEMFSGPGGMSKGASMAAEELGIEVEHAWAIDYDHSTCLTYSHNLFGAPFGEMDERMHCWNVKEHHDDIVNLPPVDVFAFGFPCNAYSLIGKHDGLDNEKYGTLYTYARDYLASRWPKAFVAENVSGISSANEGKAFAQILRDLEQPLGPTDDPSHQYVLTVHLYDASDYKVPQERQRYLITGIRADLGMKFLPPAPIPGKVTSKMALEDPPIPSDAPNNELTKQSEVVTQRLMHIPEGENAWSESIPKELRLAESCTQLSQTYRRLHSQRPSYTITGSGGGGSHVYHYTEPRALTNRERARLQSFPDDFVFVGKKEQVRKQIGMAVPCLLAKALFKVLLPMLAEAESSHATIQPNRDVRRLTKAKHELETIEFVTRSDVKRRKTAVA